LKRVLTFGAALVLLLAGGLTLAYLHWRHHVPTMRGSPTVEYTPTPVRPPRAAPGIAWPLYGYDQERTRFAPGIHLRPPFRRLWTFHGRALLEFPPVVGYGRVYITTFDGRLVAIRAATGKTVWRYSSGRCGWASPALADHLVFETFIGNHECGSVARDGEVAAFDAGNGRMRWLRQIGPTESSPLVARGVVYVGDWNGRVWALDAANGHTRWTTDLRGAIKGSVALSGQRLFIGTYGGELASLDARTGRVLWRSGGHDPLYSSPALAYGRVYIGSLDGGVYAFGATTGDLLWAHPTGGYVYASPAVWRRRVLIGSYDHRFYAFDAGTGDVLWRFNANGPISGAATVIDGLVYFSTFSERTYALDAANGRPVTTWPDGKYSPVVADSTHLYLVGLGRLYAYAALRARHPQG
jgi:outer membrane protein assembly factor BamB